MLLQGLVSLPNCGLGLGLNPSPVPGETWPLITTTSYQSEVPGTGRQSLHSSGHVKSTTFIFL